MPYEEDKLQESDNVDIETELSALEAVIHQAEQNPEFWDMVYLYEQRVKLKNQLLTVGTKGNY